MNMFTVHNILIYCSIMHEEMYLRMAKKNDSIVALAAVCVHVFWCSMFVCLGSLLVEPCLPCLVLSKTAAVHVW